MANRTVKQVIINEHGPFLVLDNGDVLIGVDDLSSASRDDFLRSATVNATITLGIDMPESKREAGSGAIPEAEKDIQRGARITDHRFRLNNE